MTDAEDIEDFLERTYFRLSEQNEQLIIELMKAMNAELIKENQKLLEFQKSLIRSNSTELKHTEITDNSTVKKSLIVEKSSGLKNHAIDSNHQVKSLIGIDISAGSTFAGTEEKADVLIHASDR